jgi:uncharacterized protein
MEIPKGFHENLCSIYAAPKSGCCRRSEIDLALSAAAIFGFAFEKEEIDMSENTMGRRDFMKSTASGLGSFVFLASNEKKQEEKQRGNRKFIYRNFGKTGVKLPIVGMGVMQAGYRNLLQAALDSGIMTLDTAFGYGRGQSEQLIGEVVKGRPRDSYFINTKVYLPRDRITGLFTREATGEMVSKNLDTTLKRLGVEYVDVFGLHEVGHKEMVLYEPAMKAMEKAKKEGKARFLGVSFHKNEPELIQNVIDSHFYDAILVSYNFKQRHYLSVRQAIAKAAEAGIGIIAMKIMGGPQSTDPLKPFNASAALKWVLQDPNVHTTVPGFCTFDEMNTDLAAMEDLALNQSEKEYLQKHASLPGLYCQQCGECLRQCLAGLPIPDLMRAYMYTYGYRDIKQGYDLIASLHLPRSICQDCGQCSVKCSIGFDVPGKIRNIARLRDVPPDFVV